MMDRADHARTIALILMYHRVASLHPDEWGLCISPQTFRDHMTEIKRTASPMSLSGLARGFKSGHVPARAVAVTFDDGCIDNLTTASPILQELELPATFFIPTERLDERHEFWWDTLERAFGSLQSLPTSLDLSAEIGRTFPTVTEADRSTAHREVADYIRGLKRDDRDEMMLRVVEWSGVDATPRETHRPMLATEVRELGQSPGFEIGAHSVHHLGLPALSDEAARQEMLDSQNVLEELVNTKVTAFAYPYGLVDAKSVGIATELFDVAVTTKAACVRPTDDLRALPRIDGNQLSLDDLRRVLDSVS